MIIYSLKDCPNNLSGVYKINFPNGKSYIGISNNIKRRMKEHLTNSKQGTLPINKAIHAYGLTDFELLENISSQNREKLQEREKYWIHFFGTMNKEKGYNITQGGDGADAGIYNLQAKLNALEIQEIYDLLLNHTDVYIYQIAEKYNISSEAISDINNGKRYYNESLSYPLRPSTTFKKGHTLNKKGLESNTSKFSQNDLDEIYDLLQNSLMTFQDIATKKGVCYATISKINRGLTYYNEKLNYPLRMKRAGFTSATNKVTPEILENIQTDLTYNLDLTFSKIGEKYGLSKDTISKINNGIRYRQKDKEYPLRKRK